MTDLFGSGMAFPYKTAPSGKMFTRSGSDRLLDSAEQVLRTAKGTCPMDPQYGMELVAYDEISRADQIGWKVANAIEYAEPRAEKIEVTLTSLDVENGRVDIECDITPIGSNVPLNRTLSLYELA